MVNVIFFLIICGIIQGLCKNTAIVHTGKKTKINDHYVFFIDT